MSAKKIKVNVALHDASRLASAGPVPPSVAPAPSAPAPPSKDDVANPMILTDHSRHCLGLKTSDGLSREDWLLGHQLVKASSGTHSKRFTKGCCSLVNCYESRNVSLKDKFWFGARYAFYLARVGIFAGVVLFPLILMCVDALWAQNIFEAAAMWGVLIFGYYAGLVVIGLGLTMGTVESFLGQVYGVSKDFDAELEDAEVSDSMHTNTSIFSLLTAPTLYSKRGMTASSSSTSFIRRLLGADRDSDQFTVTFRPLPRSSKLRRTAHAAVQKRIPSSICKMLEDENTRRRTIRLQRAKDAEQSLIALARRQLAQGLSPEQVAQQIAQQPEAAEAQALLEESEVVDGPADDLKKKPTAYVFEFKPDSEVSNLKELRAVIDMILASATTDDLVLFELESPGGAVSEYGAASHEFDRLTNAGIKTVAHVETVAASGGYLLASCCDKIAATRWARLGSIGVVVSFVNYHDALAKYGLKNFEVTAGTQKRTITAGGEMDEEKLAHLKESLETTHLEFKEMVRRKRPQISENCCQGQTFSALESVREDYGFVDEIIAKSVLLDSLQETHSVVQVRVKEPDALDRLLGKAFKSLARSVKTPVFSMLERFGIAGSNCANTPLSKVEEKESKDVASPKIEELE